MVNDLGGSVGGEGSSRDADLTVKLIEFSPGFRFKAFSWSLVNRSVLA